MAINNATSQTCLHPRTHAQARAGMRASLAWALLLSMALLFSQFLGLLHGIAHAGWPVSIARTAQTSVNAALFNYFDVDDDADSVDSKVRTQLSTQTPDQIQAQQHTQNPKHHHSCVEYDAAAGAVGIHVKLFSPPLIPGVQVLALWQAFASWDAAVVCHFSSRAPPR